MLVLLAGTFEEARRYTVTNRLIQAAYVASEAGAQKIVQLSPEKLKILPGFDAHPQREAIGRAIARAIIAAMPDNPRTPKGLLRYLQDA